MGIQFGGKGKLSAFGKAVSVRGPFCVESRCGEALTNSKLNKSRCAAGEDGGVYFSDPAMVAGGRERDPGLLHNEFPN